MYAGGFSEDMRFNSVEDYDLWLRLAAQGSRIEYLHEVLSVYRDWGQGISSNIRIHNANMMNVFEAHFKKWEPKNLYYRCLARRCRGTILRSGGRSLCRQGDYRAAGVYLCSALKHDPCDWKTWAAVLLNVFHIRQ